MPRYLQFNAATDPASGSTGAPHDGWIAALMWDRSSRCVSLSATTVMVATVGVELPFPPPSCVNAVMSPVTAATSVAMAVRTPGPVLKNDAHRAPADSRLDSSAVVVPG